jgi:tetratricopeptide (TPR) repeat protein
MLRKIAVSIAFLMACFLAAVPSARAQERVDGQLLGYDGKPLPDATIQLKSADTGQSFNLKTDKNGKFIQLGVTAGIYEMTVIVQGKPVFTQKVQIKSGVDNTEDLNLKQLAAQQQAANPEAEKKKEEAENKFKELKTQFDAGRTAITEAETLRKQISSAPADQKAALQDKVKADAQTAATAFQAAEKAVDQKDVNNHSTILAYLGESYTLAGQYNDSIDAFQKSLALKPTAGVYNQLSLSQVNAAVAETDPNAMHQKIADAGANCDKATALDASLTAMCWKNIGVVLTNTTHMPEAIAPLQKATQADPKDAQAWYLLGNALSNTITTKQEGEKLIYIVPPGTTDAYQKCIDAAPTGPYAPQCKATLDGISQLSSGVETTVSKKKKKT